MQHIPIMQKALEYLNEILKGKWLIVIRFQEAAQLSDAETKFGIGLTFLPAVSDSNCIL